MPNYIQKYDFKEGLPQEFEVVDIAQLFRTYSKDLTSPHRVGFYQILWFKKGSLTHMVDFETIQMLPNTILFINKNAVQCFAPNPDVDIQSILFTDTFFCKTEANTKYLRSSILFNDLFSIGKIQIPKSVLLYNELFQQMVAELSNVKDNAQADILRNYLHNLLLYSERERRKQGFSEVKKDANLDYVMLFKELLEELFYTQKLVSAYASQMNVTQKRLNQATSKVLGKRPKQMIDARVMLEAKRFLAHTNESVKEIGFELGFDEPTNFIKYFRKHQKATPIEFRESFIF